MHGFFLPGPPPSVMFNACTTWDFICLLPLLSTSRDGRPSPAAADMTLNWSGCCYCWIFVLHFTFSLVKGKKGTGERRDQSKIVLSVIGKSVRMEEPLLLSRMQFWRSLSANSATTAMPCEGHSLLQLAAEVLPTLNLSIASCQCVIALTHKVVYTKSAKTVPPSQLETLDAGNT